MRKLAFIRKLSSNLADTAVFSKPTVYNTITFNTAVFFWYRYIAHPYADVVFKRHRSLYVTHHIEIRHIRRRQKIRAQVWSLFACLFNKQRLLYNYLNNF